MVLPLNAAAIFCQIVCNMISSGCTVTTYTSKTIMLVLRHSCWGAEGCTFYTLGEIVSSWAFLKLKQMQLLFGPVVFNMKDTLQLKGYCLIMKSKWLFSFCLHYINSFRTVSLSLKEDIKCVIFPITHKPLSHPWIHYLSECKCLNQLDWITWIKQNLPCQLPSIKFV